MQAAACLDMSTPHVRTTSLVIALRNQSGVSLAQRVLLDTQCLSAYQHLGLPRLACADLCTSHVVSSSPLIEQYQASPGLVLISPRRRCSGWWRQKSSSANTVRTLPSPPPGCPQSKPSRRGCSRVALLITVPFQDPSHCSGR